MNRSRKWSWAILLVFATLPLAGCGEGDVEPIEPQDQEDIVPVET